MDPSGDSGAAKFNRDLQGLRAVAILLVVLYHIDHALLPGGYVGVDVFFAISGFLITGLLAREARSTGTVDLPRFYARRARRLLPAAILVLVVTLQLAQLFYSPLEFKTFGSTATATALYVGNFWFAHISTDYLRAGEAASEPLLHYWSLCVEEQFYLVWPLLVVVLFAIRRRNRGPHGDGSLLAGLAGVAVLSLAASVILTRTSQPWAFFGTPARAWEFALGGITALLVARRPVRSAALARWAALAGLAAIAASAAAYTDRTAFPGIAALLPVGGTCLLLAASTRPGETAATAFLRTRPMQVLGDLSYSWYLWHWPVILFLQQATGASTVLVGLLGAVLSLGLARLTFVYVEDPFRYNRRLVASHRLSIATGLGIAVIGAGIALAERQEAAESLASPSQVRYRAAREDRARVYDEGCHALYSATTVPECTYGDNASDTTIVLFGDSHAAQWFPALEQLATARGWQLVSLTKSACPPFEFEPFDRVLRRPYPECTQWRRNMLGRIGELRPDLVILAAAADYGIQAEGVASRAADWRAGIARSLDHLAGLRLPVALMRETPWLDESAPRCLSRAAWRGENPGVACTFTPGASPRSEESIMLEEATRLAVPVIDLNPAICPASPCSLDREGIILYLDDDHLSATFARSLAPAFAEPVERAMRRRVALEAEREQEDAPAT